MDAQYALTLLGRLSERRPVTKEYLLNALAARPNLFPQCLHAAEQEPSPRSFLPGRCAKPATFIITCRSIPPLCVKQPWR